MVLSTRTESRILIRTISHIHKAVKLMRTYTAPSIVTEANDLKSVIPTFRLASQWPDRIAITDQFGDYTYRSLFLGSKELAGQITDMLEGKIQERVAFLCPNNASYVIAQWACWMSGQIAVPLSASHPSDMLEYFIRDSDCKILLTTDDRKEEWKPILTKTGAELLILSDDLRNAAMIQQNGITADTLIKKSSMKGGLNPNLYLKYNAQIIYTSGTTAMPKGVVMSFANLWAQINAMIAAWGWNAKDTILHALPLHHIHGIVNALLTPLHVGARCHMLPKFNAKDVWDQLLAVGASNSRRVNVLTGVPTMYVKLIDEYERSFGNNRKMVDYVKATCSQKVRLMMSGSAPLPITVFEKWEQITGHRLLERYGMSEIGMALSNPLNGVRKPGFVGSPMPGVRVRIVENSEILVEGNEYSSKILAKTKSKENLYIGGLQVKGDNVFKEYWRRPEVTKKEFTPDGWFKTGDTAQYVENSYKILGRQSVDIIKSGGYKISALFIESTLLQHAEIRDVAVIGLPDSTWGQKVVAIIALTNEEPATVSGIKKWIGSKLPTYMVPSVWKVVSNVPRNIMGKVNKTELIKEMSS